MTTILAVQGTGWAVVGFDSKITTDTAPRATTLGAGTGKIAKNGPYLLGAAGDLRAINILAYAWKPPAPGEDVVGIKLDRFITSTFVPSLRKCFEDQGYAVSAKDKEESAAHNSTVLAIINGTIYEINNDYSWARDSNGVYAAGTGGDYAIGAFSVAIKQRHTGPETDGPFNSKTYQIESVRQSVRQALHIAGTYDPNSGAPYHILSQMA